MTMRQSKLWKYQSFIDREDDEHWFTILLFENSAFSVPLCFKLCP